jgi:hypothetical protein
LGQRFPPLRELKGFERITLQPGETQTVTFQLGPDELRYWSTNANGWVQDAAAFDLWVGADSLATLHAEFESSPEPVPGWKVQPHSRILGESGNVGGACGLRSFRNRSAGWNGMRMTRIWQISADISANLRVIRILFRVSSGRSPNSSTTAAATFAELCKDAGEIAYHSPAEPARMEPGIRHAVRQASCGQCSRTGGSQWFQQSS